MIDFKKLAEDMRAKRTPEENERIDRLLQLRDDNIFWKGTTDLVMKFERLQNRVRRPEFKTQEVELYRWVSPSGEVEDKLRLNFGGHREYHFDKEFCEWALSIFYDHDDREFCIDNGVEAYVTAPEVIRIVRECLDALDKKGIILE